MATRGFNPNGALFQRAVARTVRGFSQAVVQKFLHLFTNQITLRDGVDIESRDKQTIEFRG